MPNLNPEWPWLARYSAAFGLLLAILSFPAGAHEYWIEPAAFRPAVGQKVPLRLYVGQDFRGESQVYLPEVFESYRVHGPEGTIPVNATPGDDPAGHLTPNRAGLHIVAYHSTRAIALFNSRAEFENYLAKEGLERARTVERYSALTDRKVIRERYSRQAKSLVYVGQAKGLDRAIGLPLELVAERDPTRGVGDGRFPVRLLLHGKPLPGALVIAFQRTTPVTRLTARTDAEGRVVLPLQRPGIWLISAVDIVPAPRLSRDHWESRWASLTFELNK